MAITQKEILSLKPQNSAYYTWDDDRTRGSGRLGIKVYASGNKSFVFRYFRDGKRVFIQLGRFPALSLINARIKATEFGVMLKQGLDPKFELAAEERKRQEIIKIEESKGSIELLFQSYVLQMKKDKKRTYQNVHRALEKEVYPFIDKTTKACDVTTSQIIEVLAHMIVRGAATQSNRLRSYLHAAFNYGLSHDNDPAHFLRDTKFGLLFNPVSSIPKQKDAERVGERFLTFPELYQFIEDIEFDEKGVRASEAMRCLILLCIHTGGQRPYEIASSQWSEVNWEDQTLLITPELSKNKRSHLIPLTDSSIEILKRLHSCSTDSMFLFPHLNNTNEHIRLDSLTQAIARYREDHREFKHFIPRDLRRTCKTLMGEVGLSKSIRDRLQNHALNDVSSKHYDRYDYLSEKRKALELWESKLLHKPIPSSNVVSFR